MSSLHASIKKNRIKRNREKVATPFSPLYVDGGFLLPWTPEFLSNLSQNIVQPFPTPSDATHKILIKTGQLAVEIFKFESVKFFVIQGQVTLMLVV